MAGETATLIRGQDVFRTFAGVNRLRLQNVGLTEQFGRNVRTRAGWARMSRRLCRTCTCSGLESLCFRVAATKVVRRATVGASRKGRIWSHRRERVDQLTEWCKKIGAKLLDETIDPDEVLKGTLETKTLLERPAKMPISVDWPEEMYTSPEALWSMIDRRAGYSPQRTQPGDRIPRRLRTASIRDRL